MHYHRGSDVQLPAWHQHAICIPRSLSEGILHRQKGPRTRRTWRQLGGVLSKGYPGTETSPGCWCAWGKLPAPLRSRFAQLLEVLPLASTPSKTSNLLLTCSLACLEQKLLIVKERGIFTNVTSPTTKAKLWLMFEVAPLGLLIENAGGYSSDGKQSVLDKVVVNTDYRTQVAYGSEDEIIRFEETLCVDSRLKVELAAATT
uniref:Fructose-1-6-bisphosphatase class 1 C-terminal domain-containing protein n=1 Tax=Physcomitrium patens TaxID=3218 RepID=A0A2K1KH80_PHYPA|nr:hypothetical protein PHYPA_009517 [Physcomitrium patens]